MCVDELQLKRDKRRWLSRPFTFKRCWPKSNRKANQVAKACEFCGSVFVTITESLRGRFCDEECACAWKSVAYRKEGCAHQKRYDAAREKKKQQEAETRLSKWKACGWCWNAHCRQGRYCSERCQYERYLLIKRMRTESFGYDSANIECSWCGTVFFQKKYASGTKFCSNRCAKKHTVHNRKHRKRSNGKSETIGTFTFAKRRGYKCECCGIKCVKPTGNNLSNEITLDHIVPLSKGGSHTWDNVQLLCRKCNTFKRDMEWDNDRLIYEIEKHEMVKLAKAKPPGAVEIQPTVRRSAYPSHAMQHKNEVHDAGN